MAYARLERAFVGRSQVVKGVAGGPAGLMVGALAGLARLRRLRSLYVRLLRLVRIRWPAGRRCAGASSALQMPALRGTGHQTKAGPDVNGLTRKDLPSLVAVTEGRLRTRKPFIHAVVALPSVVAVKNTTTRSQSGGQYAHALLDGR